MIFLNLGINYKFVIANSFSCIFTSYRGITFDLLIQQTSSENTFLCVDLKASDQMMSVVYCVIPPMITFFHSKTLGVAMQAFLTARSGKSNFVIKKCNGKKNFVCTSSNSNLYTNDFNLHFYFCIYKKISSVCELTHLCLAMHCEYK